MTDDERELELFLATGVSWLFPERWEGVDPSRQAFREAPEGWQPAQPKPMGEEVCRRCLKFGCDCGVLVPERRQRSEEHGRGPAVGPRLRGYDGRSLRCALGWHRFDRWRWVDRPNGAPRQWIEGCSRCGEERLMPETTKRSPYA